jgi:hypothetical protein
MFAWYPIQDPQSNLQIWASRMHKNSSRIAPVSAIHRTSSIQRHQRSLSDILSNTHTGVPSRWCLLAWRSPPPETSPDRYSDTDHSHSKSSASAMQTLFEPRFRYSRSTDAGQQKQTEQYRTDLSDPDDRELHVYGWKNNRLSFEPLEKPTLGLSLMA